MIFFIVYFFNLKFDEYIYVWVVEIVYFIVWVFFKRYSIIVDYLWVLRYCVFYDVDYGMNIGFIGYRKIDMIMLFWVFMCLVYEEWINKFFVGYENIFVIEGFKYGVMYFEFMYDIFLVIFEFYIIVYSKRFI